MGTTTQALQMILNLKALEYEAAYVEMGQQYLKKLQELEKEDIVKKEHCISFMDVDLYSSSQIVYANRQGYDYIIKDYGNIRDPDFEQISFLEQDLKIIVGGIKANEIEYVEKIMLEKCYEDVKYIFSFIPDHEKQNVKRAMGPYKLDTYFALYTPDPLSMIGASELIYNVSLECSAPT